MNFRTWRENVQRYVLTNGRRGALNQIYVRAFARLECVVSVMVVHADDDTTVASVDGLYVSNLFQRRGIATEQLYYMAHVFQPTFQKILYVATTNMAGMALYSKCGWSVVSEPLPVDFQDCAPGADDMVYECRQFRAPAAAADAP